MDIRAKLTAFFRRSTPPAIETTATGFVLRWQSGAALPVEWQSVRRVAAYKRDDFTTDSIWLVLELDGAEVPVLELSEEWPGFSGLFAGMDAALGVSPSWYLEIMTPAFAPTPRVVFDRSSTDSGTSSPRGEADPL